MSEAKLDELSAFSMRCHSMSSYRYIIITLITGIYALTYSLFT